MMWKNEKKELQTFLETLNCYHPTKKFTVEYFGAKINFLDVTVMKKCNQPYVLSGLVLKTFFLINDVMNWRYA